MRCIPISATRAVGAKVNGGHVPLHTPLTNGDQVEIISTKEQAPSPLWEQFVVTGRARAEIRRYLRHAQRGEHVKLGQKILEKAFAEQGAELSEKAIGEVAKKLRLVQGGRRLCRCRARRACGPRGSGRRCFPNSSAPGRSRIQHGGRRARPPNPSRSADLPRAFPTRWRLAAIRLPGDRIVGLMTPGEGVTIHTIDCAELDKAQNMDDWLDVSWGRDAAESGPSVARVSVRVKNEPGSLAAVMTVIAANGGNIFNMKVMARNPLYFEFIDGHRSARRRPFAEYRGCATGEQCGRVG